MQIELHGLFSNVPPMRLTLCAFTILASHPHSGRILIMADFVLLSEFSVVYKAHISSQREMAIVTTATNFTFFWYI